MKKQSGNQGIGKSGNSPLSKGVRGLLSLATRSSLLATLIIGVICVICGSAYAGTWPNFSNGGGGSWLGGYYRPITITNSTASALTDYQVVITLTTATLGNPYSHIKADGSDLRFTTAPPPNSGTELSYWIESFTNTGTSIIWVKVPTVTATTGAYIYMYYGNNSAISASNISNTFVFGDDFNDQSIDINKWQNWNGTATEQADGTLKLTANTNDIRFYTKTSITNPYILETRYLRGPDGGLFFEVQDVDNGYLIALRENTAQRYEFYKRSAGTWISIGATDPAADTNWHRFKLIRNGPAMELFEDGVTKVSTTDNSFTNGMVGIRAISTNISYTDWLFVRKYASPEPSATAPGAEAQYSLTKYVQSGNWTSIVKAANPVAMGNAVAVISFTAVAGGTITTAHWRRFRIDETGGQPIEKLSVSVYEESGNDGFFDAADKFIASGTFNSNRTCYLNMNRWPLGTTAKTYYIVEKVALDGSGGQTIRLNIADGSYFDFEEGPCVGVPP